jgi:hypothetical protein
VSSCSLDLRLPFGATIRLENVSDFAPDYAEPIVGWRCWSVLERAEATRLCSPAFTTVWPPRQELVARCKHLSWTGQVDDALPPVHEAPYDSCTCGIYAGQSASTAASFLIDNATARRRRRAAMVLGRVSLWGTVVEAEVGWRGRCAYPERLWLLAERERQDHDELATALECYGVPIELLPAGSLLEFARRH